MDIIDLKNEHNMLVTKTYGGAPFACVSQISNRTTIFCYGGRKSITPNKKQTKANSTQAKRTNTNKYKQVQTKENNTNK